MRKFHFLAEPIATGTALSQMTHKSSVFPTPFSRAGSPDASWASDHIDPYYANIAGINKGILLTGMPQEPDKIS